MPQIPPSSSAPVSFHDLAGAPLGMIDLLGRNQIVAAKTAGADPKVARTKTTDSAYAKITPNNFVYKSLSNWAYNISIGCQHACRFCYVSTSQRSRPGEDEETPVRWPESSNNSA